MSILKAKRVIGRIRVNRGIREVSSAITSFTEKSLAVDDKLTQTAVLSETIGNRISLYWRYRKPCPDWVDENYRYRTDPS